MAYNSFYGGRRGASFVIVKTFSTIEEMVENFKNGNEYKEVGFEEYVLISANDKTSLDNGKIYRRGLNYTDDLGGALYIGQITGAPGPASEMHLGTKEDIQNMAATYEGSIYKEGEFNIPEGNLVPGKYEENGEIKYNDKIDWNYCTIVNDTGTQSEIMIGFTFPYTIVEYEAELVETDYADPLATREDNGEHPFYQKWKIRIPKGEKGTSISNVRIDTGLEEGEGTQKIIVSYSDETPEEEIGEPINYIMKTAVSSDYHLLVLHSDPEKRLEIKAEDKNFIWDGRDDWQDLGSIKSESGILIGMNYNTSQYPETQTILGTINFLNTKHPVGLEGVDLKGKIVTIGDDEGNKLVYAFDYSTTDGGNYKGWYYLGDFGDADGGGAGIVVGKPGDEKTETLAAMLPVNGAWFIVE